MGDGYLEVIIRCLLLKLVVKDLVGFYKVLILSLICWKNIDW